MSSLKSPSHRGQEIPINKKSYLKGGETSLNIRSGQKPWPNPFFINIWWLAVKEQAKAIAKNNWWTSLDEATNPCYAFELLHGLLSFALAFAALFGCPSVNHFRIMTMGESLKEQVSIEQKEHIEPLENLRRKLLNHSALFTYWSGNPQKIITIIETPGETTENLWTKPWRPAKNDPKHKKKHKKETL